MYSIGPCKDSYDQWLRHEASEDTRKVRIKRCGHVLTAYTFTIWGWGVTSKQCPIVLLVKVGCRQGKVSGSDGKVLGRGMLVVCLQRAETEYLG